MNEHMLSGNDKQSGKAKKYDLFCEKHNSDKSHSEEILQFQFRVVSRTPYFNLRDPWFIRKIIIQEVCHHIPQDPRILSRSMAKRYTGNDFTGSTKFYTLFFYIRTSNFSFEAERS